MTREERAREAYAQAVERLGGPARMSIAADIRADTSTEYYHVTMAAMLAFADAESAAMCERAAGAADIIADIARTNGAEFVAAGASASAVAIRALSVTEEAVDG